MRRIFTLVEEATGVELTLPVSPSTYFITHGIATETVGLDGLGDLHLPGLLKPVEIAPIAVLLPAQAYGFCNAGATAEPYRYLEQLERWCDGHAILRYILSDTPTNAAVFIESIKYGEEDGTGNLNGVLTLRAWRAPKVRVIAAAAPAAAERTTESAVVRAASYQVQPGDTLSSIARRFYGDPALYGRLAAANQIANPNLIRAGQVLTIPPVGQLPAARAKSRSQQIADKTRFDGMDYGLYRAVWE